MSHPAATNVRAFSTSPVSAAKKPYQLKRLAKAKKLLKATAAERATTSAFPMRDFLDEVNVPNESDRELQRIETEIAHLHNRITDIIDKTPLASRSEPQPHIPDAFDASATSTTDTLAEAPKRRGRRERKQAQTRAQEAFRAEMLNNLGKLLTEYQKQVAAIKAEKQNQEEVKKRKDEVLAKKRELLQQLNEREEAERRAKLVRKSPHSARSDGFDLDDILDDAMERIKKEPTHPAKKETEHVDVPAVNIVVRQPGQGAVSVLERSRQREDVLADPILDRERWGIGKEEKEEEMMMSIGGDRGDGTVLDDGSTDMKHMNAGDAVPRTSSRQEGPNISTSQPTPSATVNPNKKDAPLLFSSRTSTSSPSDALRLDIPPSGFIPIDADLIVSFSAPVPQLQQQILALRDRLKSSYPRIDTLPYDVWTSSNKRTLQTWLKILVSRWQARFDHVDSMGQLDKAIVDDRVKQVLDQMVRDHDLGNEAAERMAMRWHEVFEQRSDMRGDAEGVLDWDEMEAGGLGFLGVEEVEGDVGVPVQQQEEVNGGERPGEKNIEPLVRVAGSGSTMPGLMGRRMYSTSSRRTFWSWPILGPKLGSVGKTDGKDDAKNDTKPDAKHEAQGNAKHEAKHDVKVPAKEDAENVSPNLSAPNTLSIRRCRGSPTASTELRQPISMKRPPRKAEAALPANNYRDKISRDNTTHSRMARDKISREKMARRFAKSWRSPADATTHQDDAAERESATQQQPGISERAARFGQGSAQLQRERARRLPPARPDFKPILASLNTVSSEFSPIVSGERRSERQGSGEDAQSMVDGVSEPVGQEVSQLPLSQRSVRQPRQPRAPLSESPLNPSQPQQQPQPKPQPSLPHLTASGSAHMVSVSAKSHTTRTAVAVGTVYFSNPTPLQLIRSNSLKKGDALGTSRIAGIMAAKKCPDMIPLCHPIALTHVGVELKIFDAEASKTNDSGHGGIQIEAKVQCTGPTGVEMEALTAVMGAALSVVDMCKAVDKAQKVGDVRVVLKEGGKSGKWLEDGWKSWQE